MSIVEMKNSPRMPASDAGLGDAAWNRMMRATAFVAAGASVASVFLLVSGVGA
jgi:hypothetical protein